MILECCDLTKNYGRKLAVDNVSLRIDEGDIIGIIGPNGAGKSTLLKMFTGLIWPDSGSVSICGHDVFRNHRRAMRHIGAIIEWPAFLPDLTARQNLKVFSGGSGAEYERKLRDITSFVEINDWLDEKVCKFSTGMKQRLGIALALLPDSKFIILDEPTNGLDPGGIIEIRSIVREYNRQFGTTILLTSHLLGEIENICSRIAVLYNGRIVCEGTLDELLRSESSVIVAVEEHHDAVKLLEQCAAEKSLPIVSVFDEESEIRLHAPSDSVADINQFLVKNNIRVKRLLLKEKDLESLFLEYTGGNK